VIPQLLEMLYISAALSLIDAMGYVKEIVQFANPGGRLCSRHLRQNYGPCGVRAQSDLFLSKPRRQDFAEIEHSHHHTTGKATGRILKFATIASAYPVSARLRVYQQKWAG